MNRKYFIGIIAFAFLSMLLIFLELNKKTESPVPQSVFSPPIAPYNSYISGVGVVEASSENINIGSALHRIVENVYVTAGQKAVKGQPLIKLEDRDLQSELVAKQTAYQIAVAKQQKLELMPRIEDVRSAEASLRIAKEQEAQAKSLYDMILGLKDPRAISLQEKNRRQYRYQQAVAKRQEVQANLDKIKAGAWGPDLEIAQLEVKRAKADIDKVNAEIQRTVIRAPIDATVLQINVHEGELTPTDISRTPIMVLGNTEELFLRVSINQLDAPYFRPEAPATAFMQGDSQEEFPLEFIRVEPLLVNKENLTNNILEKVDTKVLPIIYKIKQKDHKLYVGQQMDAFIEANYPKPTPVASQQG